MNLTRRTLLGLCLAAGLAAAAACTDAVPGGGSGAGPAAAPGPLLFGIGIHIEPMGTTAQGFSTGGPSGTGAAIDYNRPDAFARAAADIEAVAAIVEHHGGTLTVQTQSPFTTTAIATGSTVLADLEERGHEVGLHFHEDAHLGKDSSSVPVETWCAVMAEEIGYIRQAGVERVEYWSGGNLFPGVFEAAACAGLSVNSDWKNPRTQTTPAEIAGTVPWRPAGGTDGSDFSAFLAHDPDGPVVFLPEGSYDRTDYASGRRTSSDEEYFAYLAERLRASVESAVPGTVNVFHFTIHPGEFRGAPGTSEPFALIDRFLAEVVDPLVAEGKVQWATYSEMAAAYEVWEEAHPGQDARTTAPAATATAATAAAPTAAAPAAQPTRPAPGGQAPGRQLPGTVRPNLAYPTEGGTQPFDLYLPERQNGALIVYVHGGGWTSGTRRPGQLTDLFAELLRRGYTIAAIDYRLAPQYPFPAQSVDVANAVAYLKAHAAEYGIDPARVGLIGGSAGGHLVALHGTTGGQGFVTIGGDAGVAAVVDLYGPADLSDEFPGASAAILQTVFGASSRSDPVVRAASPITHVSAGDPPFLLVHGEEDPLVPIQQSEEFAAALQAAGVEATLVRVANAGHGFVPEGGQPSPSGAELTRIMADFFDAHLR
jgi:acetyl esterase/lipase